MLFSSLQQYLSTQHLLFCDIWKSYGTAEENKKNWFIKQILCKMSLTFKKNPLKMSPRNNLVILCNASLYYFFFVVLAVSVGYCQQAFGCLIEGQQGEQGTWATQHGTGSQQALNPHQSKSSLAAAAASVVVNPYWPTQVQLMMPAGLVQKLLSSVGQYWH